jgi:hypothetical protein
VGSEFVGNSAIDGFEAAQLGVNFGSDNEDGELSSETVEGDEAHAQQEDDRDCPYKYVGNDEAVAETPENAAAYPSESEDKEEDTGDEG